MCVDYTDLNKACLKDASPLPNIDKLVDNSSVFRLLSFMDTYSGYNWTPMYPLDQAFMTHRELLLPRYAIQPQERRGDIQKNDDQGLQISNWSDAGGILSNPR